MKGGYLNLGAATARVRARLGVFLAGCVTVAFFAGACADAQSVIVGNDLDGGWGSVDAAGNGQFTDVPADGGSDGSRPPPAAVMCATVECPAPFVTCPMDPMTGAIGSTYACDTNTENDPDNCGGCGHKCQRGPSAFNFQESCVAGHCEPFCDTGWLDCNGDLDDGCEANLQFDRNNCGACGNECADGVDCISGNCGCAPGLTYCWGRCVDTTSDDNNCGGCDVWCSSPANQPPDAGRLPNNMHYGCYQGTCSAVRCDGNFADCNNDLELDGCEVDLSRPNKDHCGQCGNACDPGHECFSTFSTGMACQCQAPMTICPGNTCADLESDPTNCGSCGYVCPAVDGAEAACHQGRCSYTCLPGRADCNAFPIDGCEVDLQKDPRHCGGCETSCDVGLGQPCVGGQCVTKECDAGDVH